MALLKLDKVTKVFGGLTAVDQLDMEVVPGQIAGVIGPNGAGKTTVFNCITGIYKPEGGRILWQDEEITGLPPHRIAEKGVVRTFQNLRLFGKMSVAENVMSGRHFRSQQHWWNAILHSRRSWKDENENWQAVADVLDFLDLRRYASNEAGSLPYGIQRRVEIARALATEPKLLILDEPAAGLNDSETLELLEIINEIKSRGITILLIEHDMDLVMELTDYITVINFGQKISEGTPSYIQQDPHVIEAYLGSDDDDE